MKRVVLILLFFVTSPVFADSQFDHFVTTVKGDLYDGNKIFRFISFNVPNLHYIEDNLAFHEDNPFRLPDDYEIYDALRSVKQMGGSVVRIYALPVRKVGETGKRPVYVTGPKSFDEKSFMVLDRVLFYANEMGIRLIIPLVDNWSGWGGVEEYAAFRGLDKSAFWHNPLLINDFKNVVKYILNRKNVFTNRKYKDDKAILAWETGNELQCPHAWSFEITRYIKSLDANHLVIDGIHSATVTDSSLYNPFADILTTHHCPESVADMMSTIKQNCEKTRGIKPYFLGEFGFMDSFDIEGLLDYVVHSGMSGALLWSLRFHNRDGGFYWHSEPFGSDRYKAYHWPGFSSGSEYDEVKVMNCMRRKAYLIKKKPLPELPVPLPPELKPIDDVAAISWQGATGASSYRVERANSFWGKWRVVAANVTDADNPYKPLFHDKSAEIGKRYYYRVIAQNRSGQSAPGKFVRSRRVKALTLVDEFENDKNMMRLTGPAEFVKSNAKRAREDLDRLCGNTGTLVVYKLPMNIQAFNLFTIYPDSLNKVYFSVSQDGRRFTSVQARLEQNDMGAEKNDVNIPVLYSLDRLPSYSRFLRLECSSAVDLLRLEIKYGY